MKGFKLIILLLMLFVGRVSAQNDNHYENYERAILTEEQKNRMESMDAAGYFYLPMPKEGGPLYVSYSKLERSRGVRDVKIAAIDSLNYRDENYYPLTFKIIDEKNDTTTLVRTGFDWGGLTFRKIKDGGEKFTVIVLSPKYKTRVFKEVLLEDNFAMSVRLIPKDYDPTADKNKE